MHSDGRCPQSGPRLDAGAHLGPDQALNLHIRKAAFWLAHFQGDPEGSPFMFIPDIAWPSALVRKGQDSTGSCPHWRGLTSGFLGHSFSRSQHYIL